MVSRKRARSKSPVLTRRKNVTLGDILNNGDELMVTQVSRSAMKIKIGSKKGRPNYAETKSTPFEVILIAGNIKRCAGCRGTLKDGPDSFSSENDKRLCLRHKERDHIFIDAQNFWKPTFSNKHYHMFEDCVRKRNTSFQPTLLQVKVVIDEELTDFLSARFTS